MKSGQEETASYRTPWAFSEINSPPPLPLHITTSYRKEGSGRPWSLHKSSCNTRSWKAFSSINVQTPAVLGLTRICTLIKGNPFNQKIWFAWLLLVWSLEHRQQQQRHLEVSKKCSCSGSLWPKDDSAFYLPGAWSDSHAQGSMRSSLLYGCEEIHV